MPRPGAGQTDETDMKVRTHPHKDGPGHSLPVEYNRTNHRLVVAQDAHTLHVGGDVYLLVVVSRDRGLASLPVYPSREPFFSLSDGDVGSRVGYVD